MRAGKMHAGPERILDLANRYLCWVLAATGATLFAITVRLARGGLLTRRQSLGLMRSSMHFHGLAIRILRRRR
ncbi:MAG TPA: hypothetical protein VGV39_31635 [Mesorhizobium sp.]|uniref:hypothetical protein n=1 Tax=Mesorhizobium sp. TaxID=1871066 RepID=UPI002DDD6F96|nr:hypothetical protein [Mesorhizobium sp.]HEV2507661.1 hypothetical protein [Mesorhizobium sp.]